jgi:hypothetical protein
MKGLAHWRQYLLGTKDQFKIWTDHKNLEYFRKPQKLNRQQARWVTKLQNYDFLLKHQLGNLLRRADALS